jgi:hypothetical protein
MSLPCCRASHSAYFLRLNSILFQSSKGFLVGAFKFFKGEEFLAKNAFRAW